MIFTWCLFVSLFLPPKSSLRFPPIVVDLSVFRPRVADVRVLERNLRRPEEHVVDGLDALHAAVVLVRDLVLPRTDGEGGREGESGQGGGGEERETLGE